MAIQFHPHAKERMEERGTTEEEVKSTIEHGEKFPAKFGQQDFSVTFHLAINGVENIMQPSN